MTMGDLGPLWLTLKVAWWATAIALILGVTLAFAMTRTRFPGHRWLDALAMTPIVLPPTVLGYYLIVLLGRHSALGNALEKTFGFTLLFTWQGAVAAAALVAVPLIYQSARTALEEVDRDAEDAARTLGAREWQVALRVTLPLALRGIIAGAMLGFARAVGEFGATLMVAGNIPDRTQTMSMVIYEAMQMGQESRAGWLSALMMTACVLLLVSASALLNRYR